MKNNHKTIEYWIFKAEHDYRTIISLSKNDADLTDVICTHCQQCAEKYIKAYFFKIEKSFTYTHDLLRLLNELNAFENVSLDLFTWIDDIENFGIAARYPLLGGEPSRDDTTLIIASTEKVREYFREMLKEYI